MTESEILTKLENMVLEGDEEGTAAWCQKAVEEGIAPMRIIRDGMAPGATAAGEKFSSGEYFLPELIMAGEAMKAGLENILPLITADARKEASLGLVVIGSVEGDVHDIGKNILIAMLTANGFEVLDLGVDVPSSTFVEAVARESPQVLGIGSYMSTTRPNMQVVMEELEKAGLRRTVKVMVGGISVTEEFANQIGADGFGIDVPKAVELAKQFCEQAAFAATPEAGPSPWRGITKDAT